MLVSHIHHLASGVEVSPIVDAINANPQLWNEYTLRTAAYEHSDVSDIWVRYNSWKNYIGDRLAFNAEHDSSWYPVEKILPVRRVILDVMHFVGGERLGGVLITKIPAGKQCRPHVDGGWHATYYEKFAVQLQSNDQQAFHFDGESLVSKPGDLYTFDNSYTHWVKNDSESDRMTMIICIRRSH